MLDDDRTMPATNREGTGRATRSRPGRLEALASLICVNVTMMLRRAYRTSRPGSKVTRKQSPRVGNAATVPEMTAVATMVSARTKHEGTGEGS